MTSSTERTVTDCTEYPDASPEELRARLREVNQKYERAAMELTRLRKVMSRGRGAGPAIELRRLRQELDAIKQSSIWRLTAPVRLALDTVKRPRTAVARVRPLWLQVRRSAETDGWHATAGKVVRKVRTRLGLVPSVARTQNSFAISRSGKPAHVQLALRVLLISETSLAQCFKYRVAQKQRMIEYLGHDCTVVSWRDTEACFEALQTHAVVIFYRTPSFPDVMRMIGEAKALGITTFWEVDDLIFDADKYATNANLKDLSAAERQHLLSDAAIYRAAMLACDACISSTAALAQAMLGAGAKHVHVVENAIDSETLRIAEAVKAKGRLNDGFVRIVYGSGTRTHDTDFRMIAPAVLDVLSRHDKARLRVIGSLNLPAEFQPLSDRIERVPMSDYATYLTALGECDINIAPLEGSVFSDAKSNIKFLEGAVVGLPSVCSPRSAFRSAIEHGVSGFLADSLDEWRVALERLVESKALRDEIGGNAYREAVRAYSYTAIATNQVLPLLKPFERQSGQFKVLGVNIFFAPRSFGGATVVAEEMARLLNDDGVRYSMFTALPLQVTEPYQLLRYDAKGATVFGMGLPDDAPTTLDYDNPYALAAFEEALLAVRPDVVHLHSVQGIGATIAEICQANDIPYVVTLHDAWWICARQFMITPAHRYCYQRKVDLDICAALCAPRRENEVRQTRLHEVLSGAAMLLSPSAFFRDLYIANGFDPDRVVVNKNGVRVPARARNRSSEDRNVVRFGYVGGDSHIKGAHLIKKFFATAPFDNYELVVVDNTLNLGMQSIDARLWRCTGKLVIKPAYTQETIDEFFDDIDVLLFPTQWKESFGLTVREALVRDVWVIATDAGGVAEDIVPGENGDVIPFEDDGTVLTSVLTRILTDPRAVTGFQNPHKSKIRDIAGQAAELKDYLARAAGIPPARIDLGH